MKSFPKRAPNMNITLNALVSIAKVRALVVNAKAYIRPKIIPAILTGGVTRWVASTRAFWASIS
jgi:hypothetical protein